MPQLTVNGVTFNYPDQGTEAGNWGQEATDWASEVSNVLNTLAPLGTITTTQATITNNTSPGNVPGLVFESTITKAAKIFYRIERATTNEMGELDVLYDNGVWRMSQEIGASSSTPCGVSLAIDDTTGQITYSSTNTGNNGTILFKSITTLA